MSDIPRAPRPANATIEIDKSDLDEILNSPPSAPPPQVSVPPPLPPEEIARAHSMAPVQPTFSQAAPPPEKPSLVPYILVSAAVMTLAMIAVAVQFYVHRSHPDSAAPIASASAVTTTEAPASASASAAPATTTLTIHTVELGGKSSE